MEHSAGKQTSETQKLQKSASGLDTVLLHTDTSKHTKSWPRSVFRKLLNINHKDSDFSADQRDSGSEDLDDDEDWERELHNNRAQDRPQADPYNNQAESVPYRLRRSNSETLRAQYIDTKELRVCVGTWNVGGKLPPDDLNIEKWIDVEHPADIYVLGLQEIVPLNAGNIFGADDSRPVPRWECIIRETLSRVQPAKPNYKCYSDPSSPSRFKPPDDPSGTVEELLSDTDTDTDDDEADHVEGSSFDLISCDSKDTDAGIKKEELDPLKCLAMKRLQRYERFIPVDHGMLEAEITQQKKLTKRLGSSARIGLAWPEQSLDLLAKCTVDSSNSSLRSLRSFRTCRSFKTGNGDLIGYIPEFSLDAVAYKRRRSGYVKIVSKQMVGIYLTIWVRRPLRKYVQNLKVSTVGVGIMGYIGNKGSVSVSMSIYQTMFCFICTHLSSGEKIGNELRRNIGVHEIHRRTRFSSSSSVGLLQTIHDHERIIWLGDLNYRINLPYERTHELISKKKWSELLERDQLKEELNRGHAFDGWSEGHIMFPPTYKFELNSDKYIRDDKGGRRTPAWCDRILSFGTGMRLLDYRSSELTLSDHRPVTAKFMAEVEVFRHRKLQKALTLTDAEIENGRIIARSPSLL